MLSKLLAFSHSLDPEPPVVTGCFRAAQWSSPRVPPNLLRQSHFLQQCLVSGIFD